MTYAGCIHHSASENDYQEGIGYICEKCFRAEREGTRARAEQMEALARRLAALLQGYVRDQYDDPEGEAALREAREAGALP